MSAVRVRFAPSPTGTLHLGGARTALVNYLFARAHSGAFVLRIEDTDRSRNIAEAEAALEFDLSWLGIVPDESPQRPGAYGPYRQSERADAHTAAFERLLTAGKVYAAQDDDETSGIAYRFRLDPGARRIVDLLHGEVDFAGAPAPDPVVRRSDGSATFLFANAVDDAEQAITHVIRGDDHLPNAWKQAQIHRALGYEPPHWAHLPLILGADHKPLSKRHGPASVGSLRDLGYPAEAVVLALAHLGMTPPEIAPGAEIWGPLVAAFRLEALSTAAAIHDQGRLDHLSAAWLRALSALELAERVRDRADRHTLIETTEDPDWWPPLLALMASSFTTLEQAISSADRMLQFGGAAVAEGRAVLAAFRENWPVNGLADESAFKALTDEVGRLTQTKGKALFHPLRLALTGVEQGPALARLAPLIDRAARDGGMRDHRVRSCRERIDIALTGSTTAP